ncbi:SAP DNA-binding domain-containing protein [Cavenderia fasciculata]|uniref:RING-type E3 ubiquitin transferase n=1 Tax=Cavenderia fasciculata TaxID=261658 RepID=F4PSY4_CACFS|nr:SAP DNA-binding domain-containing protein [Cavenderia fasciculata]EGG20773.1 SAP DNA-binding domain-containing protein [Cavenderia fasciculata]|eukprot:XP_004358623.1 SAP DNA-binding domain-containing protein [Cavenderia fasciculata]
MDNRMDKIEDLLRCPICYDLYTTCMMIPLCSHNFCSLCIRQHFQQQKLHCPVCRKAATSIDIKNNRLLDDLVHEYKKVQSVQPTQPLLLLTNTNNNQQQQQQNADNDDDDLFGSNNNNNNTTSTSTSTSTTNTLTPTPFTKRKKRLSASPDTTQNQSQPIASTRRMTTRSMSASASLSTTTAPTTLSDDDDDDDIFDSKKKKSPKKKRKSISESDDELTLGDLGNNNNNNNNSDQVVTLSLPTPDKISCPFCKAMIVSRFLEKHMDSCIDSPTPNNNNNNINNNNNNQQLVCVKLTPLPKLCYHLMKTKQVKELLKKVNMKMTGDRQTLVNRHREYTTRRNAECDSLCPKTHEEIVELIYQNEQLTAKPKPAGGRRSKSLPAVLALPAPPLPISPSLPSPPISSSSSSQGLSLSQNSISSPPIFSTQNNNNNSSNDLFEILKLQILNRYRLSFLLFETSFCDHQPTLSFCFMGGGLQPASCLFKTLSSSSTQHCIFNMSAMRERRDLYLCLSTKRNNKYR